jgi:hypothetical protein
MVVVTPVPEDPNEKAVTRWRYRQALQTVLASLGTIRGQLDTHDDLEQVVADRIMVAQGKVKEAMELLSPTPKAPKTKRKPHLHDR